MAGYQRQTDQLIKLLQYVLERHPDEFGLVPDRDGYVRVKDLIKALNEDEEVRAVRPAQIDQLFRIGVDLPLERNGSLIRARNRERLPAQTVAEDPPALLYTCVRQRAYRGVCEKGITGMGDGRVVLAAERPMAERIGRRFDRQAVLLTVNTRQGQGSGVMFLTAGNLFWAGHVPPGCFTGPPLPEEKPASKKPVKEKKALPTPGSFVLDPLSEKAISRGRKPPRKGRGGYGPAGKKKIKRKRQPPPWRS